MRRCGLLPIFCGFLLVWGCGGAAKNQPPPQTDTTPAPAVQQHAYTYPEETLPGAYFVPEALYSEAMPVRVTLRGSLKSQRRRYKRAKGAKKVKEGEALAAMLWGKKGGQQEARKILRDITADGKAPEEVLIMRGVAEESLKDPADAAKVYEELMTRFANSSEAPVYKARRAFLALVNGDDAKAVELAKDWDPASPDLTPQAAYVTAWVQFRQANQKAAAQAINTAAKKWAEKESIPAVERDVLIMNARAGNDVDSTLAVLKALADKVKRPMLASEGQLAEAYLKAGEYALREKVLEVIGKDQPAAVVAEIKFHEADVEFRLNHPKEAADNILASWDAAQKADKIADAVKSAIAENMFEFGTIFQADYATSFDKKYGEQAVRLYKVYGAIPGAKNAKKAQGLESGLSTLMSRVGPGVQGTLDKGHVQRRIVSHKEQVVACYEKYLQTNKDLEGTVKAIFDVGQDGKVSQVVTEPKKGASGLPAVAGCLQDKISTWNFAQPTAKELVRAAVTYKMLPAAKAKAEKAAEKAPAAKAGDAGDQAKAATKK